MSFHLVIRCQISITIFVGRPRLSRTRLVREEAILSKPSRSLQHSFGKQEFQDPRKAQPKTEHVLSILIISLYDLYHIIFHVSQFFSDRFPDLWLQPSLEPRLSWEDVVQPLCEKPPVDWHLTAMLLGDGLQLAHHEVIQEDVHLGSRDIRRYPEISGDIRRYPEMSQMSGCLKTMFDMTSR